MNRRFRILFIVFSFLVLTGCQNSSGTYSSAPSVGSVEEWSVNPELSAVTLPDDAQKALDDSEAASEENQLKPIALLGRQVVSGTNYAVLCSAEIQKNHIIQRQLEVVTVYQDLNGKSSVLSVVPINAETFVHQNCKHEQKTEMTGAFETDPADCRSQDDPEIKDGTMNKTVNSGKKDENHPVALLWNGLDHNGNRAEMAVLCMREEESGSYWNLITVHAPDWNHTEILSQCAVDPGDYVQYGNDNG